MQPPIPLGQDRSLPGPSNGQSPFTFGGIAAFLQSGYGMFNVADPQYSGGANIGGGGLDSRFAFNAAAAACGIAGGVFVPPGTYKISANMSLSSPIVLAPGAILKPDNGVIVFLQAAISASLSKHFDLSAGGKVRVNGVPNSGVYAEWFGAVGDGLTDDTVALQNAIDSCAYNNGHIGGVVQLCNSGYAYTALDLTGGIGGGAGVELRGVGRYSTTLFATAVGGISILMNGAGCKISDLRIQTAVLTTPNATQVMVSSTGGSACELERVDFYKYYNGVQVNGVHMRDCIFDYGLAGGIGVDMTDSVGSTMEDVVLTSRYAGFAHFLLQGVGATTPDTNLFTRCSTNANLTAASFATYGTPNTGATVGVTPSVIIRKNGGSSPRWSRFTDCLFETSSQNGFLHCFQYLAGQDTKVTGGYILGGTHAVDIQGATADYKDEIIFESTIIHGANLRGVYHNPADVVNQTHVTLQNCTIANNSNTGVGAWPGVELGANSRGFTMRGGVSGATLGVAAQQQFGILVNAGAADYLLDLDSIDLNGNVTGPVAGHTPTVASAATITPIAQQVIISGVAAIVTIIVPRRFKQIRVIPTGLFTWTAGDNIAVAGSAVVGKLLVFTYEQSTGKFYPSYTA